MNVHFDVDIVSRDDRLPTNGTNLDLDVDSAQRLCADVDFDETRVDRPVELSKARHETDGT